MSDSKSATEKPLLRPESPPPAYTASQSSPKGPKASPSPRSPLSRGPFPLDLPILNELRGKRVVLASASPRRKQLLAQVQPTSMRCLRSLGYGNGTALILAPRSA